MSSLSPRPIAENDGGSRPEPAMPLGHQKRHQSELEAAEIGSVELTLSRHSGQAALVVACQYHVLRGPDDDSEIALSAVGLLLVRGSRVDHASQPRGE